MFKVPFQAKQFHDFVVLRYRLKIHFSLKHASVENMTMLHLVESSTLMYPPALIRIMIKTEGLLIRITATEYFGI